MSSVRALKSFVGISLKMRKGEVKEIADEAYATRLIEGGLVEVVEGNKPKEPDKKTKTKNGGKTNV